MIDPGGYASRVPEPSSGRFVTGVGGACSLPGLLSLLGQSFPCIVIKAPSSFILTSLENLLIVHESQNVGVPAST